MAGFPVYGVLFPLAPLPLPPSCLVFLCAQHHIFLHLVTRVSRLAIGTTGPHQSGLYMCIVWYFLSNISLIENLAAVRSTISGDLLKCAKDTLEVLLVC
ncbi:hypothetical protein OBBRIDRAFT_13112 [Obba rivulosa]|uniref:Uncharacterized protein n=1 Tax=Obba rivulosa TaxID=1052685 RepID=A0A8E2DVK6_9APHY|nr:hypothetical protein OBBRIDRAFT_13112 [Obba rivulosa]